MSLDDMVQHFLDDPDNEEVAKDNIRSLMGSHIVTGMKLQKQGLLREAISEFAQENNRPIRSDIDKEIVQNSFWHIGKAYQKLGELENAKAAFQKADKYWKLYGVGTPPQYNLAEILLEQGKIDDAIVMCQELLDQIPDGGTKELLAKALAMKKDRLE
jgi:tetratricopeptide (TPR) repeat protein